MHAEGMNSGRQPRRIPGVPTMGASSRADCAAGRFSTRRLLWRTSVCQVGGGIFCCLWARRRESYLHTMRSDSAFTGAPHMNTKGTIDLSDFVRDDRRNWRADEL